MPIEGTECRTPTGSHVVGGTNGLHGRDDAGRERLLRNLGFAWVGQLVFIAAGFVLPRVVNTHMGRAGLGVWDFGWSIVGYFGLTQLGLASAVHPFVAKYRGRDDVPGLNRAISSALAVQLAAAAVVVGLAGAAAYLAPIMAGVRLGPLAADARWVVGMLGLAIALQIAFNTFGGVITGCHRWDIHNAIDSSTYGLVVLGMLVLLNLGYGLRAMAAVYLCGTLCAEIVRTVVAHRVCRELRVAVSAVARHELGEMYRFGMKVFIGSLSSRLLYQTTSVWIASLLGPGVLALYTRPMSLVQHIGTFVSKLAFFTTPIASELSARGNKEAVSDLMIETTRYSALMTLPGVGLLAILGGPLLRLWMGPGFEQPALLATLALGHAMSFAHRPVSNVLVGLALHGKPALFGLAGALACTALVPLTVWWLGGGLVGAGVSVVLPLILGDGIVLPVYACRRVNVSVRRFYTRVWGGPVLYSVPTAIWAFCALRVFEHPAVALCVGGIGGVLIQVGVYWRWALSPLQRERLAQRLLRF